MRDALRALQTEARYSRASLQADAAVLAARIRGALAAQGDAQAAAMVSTQAALSPARLAIAKTSPSVLSGASTRSDRRYLNQPPQFFAASSREKMTARRLFGVQRSTCLDAARTTMRSTSSSTVLRTTQTLGCAPKRCAFLPGCRAIRPYGQQQYVIVEENVLHERDHVGDERRVESERRGCSGSGDAGLRTWRR